ncbi:MAG: hypothetical protein FIA95_13630 [Gemmatimonadetes bacterium]|nr:hypothetical protein [Gemmatimonadota bacterium]
MDVLPVDLTALLAVFMGISIVLVPVIGITARFALKPTVEALARLFERRGIEDTVALLERRMALLEQQMESLDTSVKRLAEVAEFHRALSSGEKAELPKGEE